ncbi:MAG: DNA polymerase/3'-5' exonuclease PolX [Verrucomicrobiota bacterium]
MDNATIAAVLEEIGTILEIKGENPFKCRAYFNSARVIEGLMENVATLVAENRLGELEGIGETLKERIQTLVETGKLSYYDELKASLPEGLMDLLKIPGVGPKKVKTLYEKLKVTNIELLEKACHDGSVAKLAGFGEKTAKNILAGIEQIRSYQNQHRYGDVIGIAEGIVEILRAHPEIIRISVAGSLRRGKEVVKDIDIIASSKNPAAVMDAFCALPGVMRVLNHGETKSAIVIGEGLQCDLRIVPDTIFPYALHHLTGSKEHNVAMRQLAISKKMKMSEWGLFHIGKTDEETEKNLIPCKDESELFGKFGMEYIPPELRENLGEIEAAQAHQLPRLVEWTDLRGCFHNHTIASDGHSTLEEMAQAAAALGFEYLGIADHSKSSFQANGLSEEKLLEQIKQIRAYNAKKPECVLLAGVECDILKDGTLDYDDSILQQLDYVVASVHSSFTLSEEDMTRRIIRAMENPHVTMLGHLTGRLLLRREAYAVNIPKIIDAAATTETWIELNAHPERLDMDWRWWKLARDKGAKCVINPDAHHTSHLSYVKLGVQIARKGWLRKEDVINTCNFNKFRQLL